jgi:hypothetical protein
MADECFVIGPIGDRLAPVGSEGRGRYEESIVVYEDVIQAACSMVGLSPIRADEIAEPGEVTESICLRLRDSPFVVADVTGANANVMYELGLRHSTGKPTVQVGEDGRLPFDISAIRTVRFIRSPAGLVDARKRLEETLRSAIGGAGTAVTSARVFSSAPALLEPVVAADLVVNEEPGFIDLLVEMEAAFPALSEVLTEMTTDMEQLGALTTVSTGRVEYAAEHGGARAVQVEAARLASELEPVADRMEAGASKYESKLAELDAGVRAIIAAIKTGQTTPGEFPRQIRDLAQASRVAMASADGLATSVGNNESLSRSLRVPFRRIRLALGRIVEAAEVIQEWETSLG